MRKWRKRSRAAREHRHPIRDGLLFQRATISEHAGEKNEDYVDYEWVEAHKSKIEEYFTRTFDFFPPGWVFYENVDQKFTEDCFSIDAGVHADVAETKRVITGNFKRLCLYHAFLGVALMLGLAFAAPIAASVLAFTQ